MARDREEQFEQDNLGNVNRRLDQVRSLEGMEGSDDDDNGIVEIAGGDTGTDLIVYELPTHASRVYLSLIQLYNNSGGAGNYQIYDATLDDQGAVDTTTRRTVPINVADGATRSIGYEGVAFDQDAIVVNAAQTGFVGISVFVDHDQSDEPASEVTQSP